MATKEDTISRELFEKVIYETIKSETSPCKRLEKIINDIDIDFFEDITRDKNVLSPELNMGLKEKVTDAFRCDMNALLDESGIEQQVLSDVHKSLVVLDDTKIVAEVIHKLKSDLHKYAEERLLFVPAPEYDMADLQEKYDRAREITVMERIMRNNKKDVIDFYHALLNRTEWECQNIMERSISELLQHIVSGL